MSHHHPLVRRLVAAGGIAVLTVSGAAGVSQAQTGSLGGAAELTLNLDLALGSGDDGSPGSALPYPTGSLEGIDSGSPGSSLAGSSSSGSSRPTGSLDDIEGSVGRLLPAGPLDAPGGSLTVGSGDNGSLKAGPLLVPVALIGGSLAAAPLIVQAAANVEMALPPLPGPSAPKGSGGGPGIVGGAGAAAGVNAVVVMTGSVGDYEVVLPDGATLPPLPFIR